MTYYKKLVGKKCYLSPCLPEDAEKWTEWFNDLAVALPLGDEAYTPATPTGQREAIEEIIKNKAHIFSMVDLKTEMPIGRCLLFNLDHVNRSAMFGIFIGEKTYWGQGYGQEATQLLLDYGFNLLNLNNIMLGVMSFNQRALRSYRSVGFKEIGRRRQARIIGQQKFDVIFMDILAEEFVSVYVRQFIA
ncbi:MAG: GNAT family N-acetyltransferase [Anaerolineae bacterium]|nr:GNAT family N-acetyltransferase [Anaerolineae bacterium]